MAQTPPPILPRPTLQIVHSITTIQPLPSTRPHTLRLKLGRRPAPIHRRIPRRARPPPLTETIRPVPPTPDAHRRHHRVPKRREIIPHQFAETVPRVCGRRSTG